MNWTHAFPIASPCDFSDHPSTTMPSITDDSSSVFIRALCIAAVVVGATTGCSAVHTPVDNWVVAETEHVRLRTELPVADARKLAAEMQEIRDAFASAVLKCAFERDMGPIEVTALPPNQFERIARPGSGGYYQGYGASWVDYPPQIVIPTTFQASSRQVYQHELTHRLNAVCFSNAPVWVNEGLAKFLETAIIDNKRLSIGLPAFLFVSPNEGFNAGGYQGMELQIVPRDFTPSVSTLVRMRYDEFYADSDTLAQLKRSAGNYSAAWSLVHLLELEDPELQTRFARYLGALHTRRVSPQTAWDDEFRGVDLEALVTAYRAREQLPYVDVPYEAPTRKVPQARAMRPGEAHVHWSWLLGSKYRDQALGHASAALSDPSSAPLARVMAASLYVEADQDAKAEAEVQKGLVSNPQDPRLLHAQLQFELDASDGLGRRRMLDLAVERLHPVARTAAQWNVLGNAELTRGNADAALQYSRRGLAERPACWTCRVTEGVALAKLSRWSEAIDSLEVASRWISHENSDARKKIQHLIDKIRRAAERR